MGICIYCGKPTRLEVVIGGHWKPAHKRCVRPVVAKRKSHWRKIREKSYTAYVQLWVKQSPLIHGSSAKEARSRLAKKLRMSPKLIRVERKR